MLKRKKILIIKPSSLGDIIHSLPVLNAIKRSFADAEIHWVVAKGFEGILESHPLIKRMWVVNKDEWKEIAKVKDSLLEFRRLFRDLKAERFDYAIDLQGLLRSGIIAEASGAPVRVGFKEAREGSTFFYTHTVIGGEDIHAVDRYLKIAAFLGCDTSEVRFPFPPAGRTLAAEVPFAGFSCGNYAVMTPGARGPAKRWPARRFGELASTLPIKTLVVGSKGDVSLAEEVVGASKGKAISLTGKTDLKGLTEIIQCARFMVCNDTGPMHIAAALGVHVFALFGPTNSLRTGPYGSNHTIVKKDMPCAPCYKKSCKTIACMDMIKTEEVSKLITEFLSGGT
ncbi:MAG: lipopolysaccharide heptosyltransferase II [Thermodesulfovibrionales bacterium]|jgi:lipopolysaccharide heptosyltransferase I